MKKEINLIGLLDDVFKPENVNNHLIQQVYDEFLYLGYFLKGLRPVNILEIGTLGGSFHFFNILSTGIKIGLNIDSYHIEKYNEINGEDDNSIFIHGNSHEQGTFDKVKEICDSFDFIFIDGDHTYEGVKIDFYLYKELLSDNGYIGFHDIDPEHIFVEKDRYNDVNPFWNELQDGNKTSIICNKSNVGKIFMKKDEKFHNTHFGGIGLWRP